MSEQSKAVFSKAADITLKVRGTDGVKTAKVRFPTDEEWNERQKKLRFIVKAVRGGEPEIDPMPAGPLNAEFLELIRTDGGSPALDPHEASDAIEKLSRCEVVDIADGGATLTISLDVPGGTTTHELKVPSAKDRQETPRLGGKFGPAQFGRRELRISLEPSAALYKSLLVGTTGYDGDVPVIHQAAVADAAIRWAGRPLEDEPNF